MQIEVSDNLLQRAKGVYPGMEFTEVIDILLDMVDSKYYDEALDIIIKREEDEEKRKNNISDSTVKDDSDGLKEFYESIKPKPIVVDKEIVERITVNNEETNKLLAKNNKLLEAIHKTLLARPVITTVQPTELEKINNVEIVDENDEEEMVFDFNNCDEIMEIVGE